MKLTKALIRQFERSQKDHGTETALFNMYFIIGTEILKAAGCTRTRVERKYDRTQS